jgi:hydrogenase-4 component F
VVTALLLALIGPWALSAALAAGIRPYRPAVGWVANLGSLVSVGAALGLWHGVLAAGSDAVHSHDLFRVDALSALVAFCVAVVASVALAIGPGGDPGETHAASAIRKFRIHGSLFALAMLLAVTVNNVALMWVAIEATTIFSALLIPLHRTKASVEASWKYLFICSVGIALAFAGTVLAYFAFVTVTGNRHDALDWPRLMAAAATLNPELLRLAFVFLLVGYGTKAALAPLHTWLPDAHSEAPAPLSAMMSGVLLAVAQYAILRWKAVVDASPGGAAFTNAVLVTVGLLSVLIGALSLVRQRSYKRLLAYSSVEHSGLICLGFTFGPAGVFASMLHVLNHALAKSTAFLMSGRILARYGSTDIDKVGKLMRTMPVTGTLFGAGLLALMGLPPFGIFISEFLLFRAGILAGHLWQTGAALLLAGIGFVGIARHLLPMLYGVPAEGVATGERGGYPGLVLAGLCVCALITLGLYLPGPVTDLLNRIVEALIV